MEDYQEITSSQPVNSLLGRLTGAVLDSSNWSDLLKQVLRLLAEAFRADSGESWQGNVSGSRLWCETIWNSPLGIVTTPSPKRYCAYGEGVAGLAWQQGQWGWHQLSAQPVETIYGATVLPDLKAALALPIKASPAVGVICLYFTLPDALNSTLKLLLQCLTTQLNALCQLRQTILASQAKQRQLQRLIDVMPGIVFQANPDAGWSMQYLSAGGEVITGYQAEQLVDRDGNNTFNTIDRKAVEQLLKSREDFLQMVLNSIPSPVFWKDRQGRFLGCNQAFAKAMGKADPEQIVGLTDHDLPHLSSEEVAYYRACDRMIMDRGEADLHVIEPQTYASGEQRWISNSRLPMRNQAGEVIGILGIFDDITEQLAAQEALKTREKYLSTISELQRPLRTWNWHWTESQLETLLAALGKAASASRVYFYELISDQAGQQFARQRVEWSAPGVPSTKEIPIFQALPIDPDLNDWFAVLEQGGTLNLTQDEFSEAQRQLLATPPSNVKSLLLLPLMVQGKLLGAMGFSNCALPRHWDSSEVDLLRVATADIALAMERRQAELALKQAENKFRSMFENAVEGIFQTTLEGRYTIVNPMLARLYGYSSPAEMIETLTHIKTQLYVDSRCRQRFINQIEATGAAIGFEAQVYRKDGSIIWISESARAIYDAHGHIIGYEGTVEDITKRKLGEAEILHRDRLLQGVAEASHHLLSIPDFEQAIPRVLAILGEAAAADRVYIYEHHRVSNQASLAMSMRFEWTRPTIAPSIDQPHWQNKTYWELGVDRWYQAFAQGKSIRGLVRDFPPQEQMLLGQDDILSILMVPIFVEHYLWGYIGFDACQTDRDWTINDESILVTIAATLGAALKRQQTEAKMCYQAYHDSLTGLPNRSFFNQHLPQVIEQARQHHRHLAVIFLDLDHFKTINDTLSHAVGDELLRQVTQRIAGSLGHGDVAARWGGDEFTLILPNITSPEDAAQASLRIANSLSPPFILHGHELHVTTSMGIAVFPQDGADMTTLLQNADTAMYQAKSRGRNNYQFYTQHLGREAAQRLRIESVLYHALERQEFHLVYQPQINARSGQVSQMEALIRWQHPELGTISPDRFIPLAEENGLIIPIGEWVIWAACTQAMEWHKAGLGSVRVAVNLSPRQLQHPQLVNYVVQVLAETGLPPHCLELEITETAAMADVNSSIRRLQELKELEIRASMDDFGTGYSCLSYLKQFPLDGLKIDRAFIQDLPNSMADQAMVQAIVSMAQGLNLQLIAEGVETQEQVDHLQALGCHQMQGYFFSRPMPAKDTEAYLRRISLHGL